MLEEERRRRRTESGDAGTARPVVRTSYIRNLPKNLGNAGSVYLERAAYTGERCALMQGKQVEAVIFY